jgi:hypothetical protein
MSATQAPGCNILRSPLIFAGTGMSERLPDQVARLPAERILSALVIQPNTAK